MKRFTVVLAIIMCAILTGCQSDVVRENVEVSAIVTEMKYEESYSRYNTALRMPQYSPEKYLVTVSYEDMLETFNDKSLYERVKEGDSIQLILCKCYDGDGNLIYQTIELPK